jgi:hypothetical protein
MDKEREISRVGAIEKATAWTVRKPYGFFSGP